MEDKNDNALERFIRKTRALFAREPDLEKRWKALAPVLAGLVAGSVNWAAAGAASNRTAMQIPAYSKR